MRWRWRADEKVEAVEEKYVRNKTRSLPARLPIPTPSGYPSPDPASLLVFRVCPQTRTLLNYACPVRENALPGRCNATLPDQVYVKHAASQPASHHYRKHQGNACQYEADLEKRAQTAKLLARLTLLVIFAVSALWHGLFQDLGTAIGDGVVVRRHLYSSLPSKPRVYISPSWLCGQKW